MIRNKKHRRKFCDVFYWILYNKLTNKSEKGTFPFYGRRRSAPTAAFSKHKSFILAYSYNKYGTNPKKTRCGFCRRRDSVPTVTSSKRKSFTLAYLHNKTMLRKNLLCLRHFVRCWLFCIIERVRPAEGFPLLLAHFMKRQKLHPFNTVKPRQKFRQLF